MEACANDNMFEIVGFIDGMASYSHLSLCSKHLYEQLWTSDPFEWVRQHRLIHLWGNTERQIEQVAVGRYVTVLDSLLSGKIGGPCINNRLLIAVVRHGWNAGVRSLLAKIRYGRWTVKGAKGIVDFDAAAREAIHHDAHTQLKTILQAAREHKCNFYSGMLEYTPIFTGTRYNRDKYDATGCGYGALTEAIVNGRTASVGVLLDFATKNRLTVGYDCPGLFAAIRYKTNDTVRAILRLAKEGNHAVDIKRCLKKCIRSDNVECVDYLEVPVPFCFSDLVNSSRWYFEPPALALGRTMTRLLALSRENNESLDPYFMIYSNTGDEEGCARLLDSMTREEFGRSNMGWFVEGMYYRECATRDLGEFFVRVALATVANGKHSADWTASLARYAHYCDHGRVMIVLSFLIQNASVTGYPECMDWSAVLASFVSNTVSWIRSKGRVCSQPTRLEFLLAVDKEISRGICILWRPFEATETELNEFATRYLIDDFERVEDLILKNRDKSEGEILAMLLDSIIILHQGHPAKVRKVTRE